MLSRDRRLGFRIPSQFFLTQYIDERPYRALTRDLSGTGLRLDTVAAASRPLRGGEREFGVEFELPGTGEVIWARARACHERAAGPTLGLGIRFTAMARAHERLLADFCIEARHSHVDALLARIHSPALA